MKVKGKDLKKFKAGQGKRILNQPTHHFICCA